MKSMPNYSFAAYRPGAGLHGKFGLVLVCFVFFQPLNAFIRPPVNPLTLWRRAWSAYHSTAGWLAVVLAPAVIIMGLNAIDASFLYVLLYAMLPLVAAGAYVFFFYRTPRRSVAYAPLDNAALNGGDSQISSM